MTNARMVKMSSLLASFLLAGLLAVASNAGAASPWFNSGSSRPNPQGNVRRQRVPEPERERGRRGMYREERFIRLLYQGFLDRMPSHDEIRSWADRLGRDDTPANMVQEFMDSDEFFIRQMYRGLLGRDPDVSGKNNHMSALQRGASRADVVEMFLGSDEFRGRMR